MQLDYNLIMKALGYPSMPAVTSNYQPRSVITHTSQYFQIQETFQLKDTPDTKGWLFYVLLYENPYAADIGAFYEEDTTPMSRMSTKTRKDYKRAMWFKPLNNFRGAKKKKLALSMEGFLQQAWNWCGYPSNDKEPASVKTILKNITCATGRADLLPFYASDVMGVVNYIWKDELLVVDCATIATSCQQEQTTDASGQSCITYTPKQIREATIKGYARAKRAADTQQILNSPKFRAYVTDLTKNKVSLADDLFSGVFNKETPNLSRKLRVINCELEVQRKMIEQQKLGNAISILQPTAGLPVVIEMTSEPKLSRAEEVDAENAEKWEKAHP